MNNYLDTSHGMELNPNQLNNQRENENGIHFLVIHYMLKFLNNGLTTEDLIFFESVVGNITTYDKYGNRIKGLYDRGAKESLKSDKSSVKENSHDNINAIVCFSKSFNFTFHNQIYRYGVDNKWRFDNVYPEKPRFSRTMHPRDIIFWSFLHKKFWARLCVIEPLLECILTCYKKHDIKPRLHERILYFFTRKRYVKFQNIATSGKLLAFVRLFTLRKTWYGKLTWKICTYFINRNFEEGWKGVVDFYFKDPNHPIRKEIAELYARNKGLFDEY